MRIELLINGGNMQGAFTDLQNLLKLDDKNPDTWFSFSQYYLSAGNNAQAEQAFKTCLDIDQDHIDGNIGYAIFLNSQNKHALAMHFVDHAISLQPEESGWKRLKINTLMDTQKFDEAIELIETTLENDPKLLTLYHKLAQCYTTKQDFSKIESVYRRSIIQFNKGYDGAEDAEFITSDYPVEQMINLAKTYLYSFKNMKKAKEVLDETINNYPNNSLGYSWTGTLLLQQNGKDDRSLNEAEKYFKKALKKNNKDHLALNNMGLVLFKKKKWNQSLKYIDSALEIISSNYEAWNMKALIQLSRNDKFGAAKSFENAVKYTPDRHPNWLEIRKKLFGCYVETRQFEKAEALSRILKRYGIMTPSFKYPGRTNMDY
ncbi:MAG: tetratricopeptide repeat protein [Candidatus Kariarchaeaceae archaeon]